MKQQENPSPEELAHYGVLGMKWGHRKTATTADIHAARRRIATKQQEHHELQTVRSHTTPGSKARAKADRDLETFTKNFKNDPARVIAVRMTRGEKIITALLAGPVAAIPIGATSALSRRIEKKQDDNAYNKK